MPKLSELLKTQFSGAGIETTGEENEKFFANEAFAQIEIPEKLANDFLSQYVSVKDATKNAQVRKDLESVLRKESFRDITSKVSEKLKIDEATLQMWDFQLGTNKPIAEIVSELVELAEKNTITTNNLKVDDQVQALTKQLNDERQKSALLKQSMEAEKAQIHSQFQSRLFEKEIIQIASELNLPYDAELALPSIMLALNKTLKSDNAVLAMDDDDSTIYIKEKTSNLPLNKSGVSTLKKYVQSVIIAAGIAKNGNPNANDKKQPVLPDGNQNRQTTTTNNSPYWETQRKRSEAFFLETQKQLSN